MSEAKEVRVKEKTLKRALKEAAQLLGSNAEQIEHRVVSQVNGGMLFFLGRSVEIVAWKKRAARTVKGAVAREITQDELEQPKAIDEKAMVQLQEELRSFCEDICRYMTGEDVEVRATFEEERLILDIDNDFLAAQISKNGKLAEAMEHLIRKKPRHLKRELPFRVFVDVKGSRREREEGLVELAQDLSNKVDQNRRPIVLNYRSAYDRKIIHMALEQDERVYTKSIGHGSSRKLMILPAKGRDGLEMDAHDEV